MVLSILLFWLAVRLRHRHENLSLKWNGLMALAAVVWLPVAVVTLVNSLSAYHYGVLQHQCPWCLFLFQHGSVGFPLFAALMVVTFEGPLSFLLPATVRATPAVFPAALDRSRTAASRVIWSLLVFTLLSVLPAIIWRLRFGVWISG